MTLTRFEGAEKPAESFLLLTPDCEEFQPVFLSLCRPNHCQVDLQRGLLSRQTDLQRWIHADVDTRLALNLTNSDREVAHCA